MKKYYIGILALCVLVLGLTGYTLIQSAAAKQDVQTEKNAQEIAKKLNDYVGRNKEIPESLNEAGVSDAPKTVRYSKKSDKEYEFCVTYKSAKTYGYSGPETLLTGSITRNLGTEGSDNDYYGDTSYKPSTLYLGYTHKKGDNCQTVNPYIGSYNFYDDAYTQPKPSMSSKTGAVKARDTQRVTDINNIHSKLEVYYNDNSFYPSTFTAATFPGIDSESLKDPNGISIAINSPVTDAVAAKSVNGQSANKNYLYIPFGCAGANKTECEGYYLKTWIESPSVSTPNPVVKIGLNNP